MPLDPYARGVAPDPKKYVGKPQPMAVPVTQGTVLLGCVAPIIFGTVGIGLFVLIMGAMIGGACVARDHVVPGFLGVMGQSGTPQSRAAAPPPKPVAPHTRRRK
jgi:hypothetical protein